MRLIQSSVLFCFRLVCVVAFTSEYRRSADIGKEVIVHADKMSVLNF